MDEHRVEIPDYGEIEVEAFDSRQAAEKAVEKFENDSAEWTLATNDTAIEVIVRWGRDSIERFLVGASFSIDYFARKA